MESSRIENFTRYHREQFKFFGIQPVFGLEKLAEKGGVIAEPSCKHDWVDGLEMEEVFKTRRSSDSIAYSFD